jgi:hypothetical protein
MIETTEMRSQFEAQFIEEYVRVLGEGARELAAHTLATNPPLVSMSWWAWQASRESVVVELPKVVGFEGAYDSHRHHEFVPSMSDVEDADEIFGLCRRVEAKEAIEAQGLKVAPC